MRALTRPYWGDASERTRRRDGKEAAERPRWDPAKRDRTANRRGTTGAGSRPSGPTPLPRRSPIHTPSPPHPTRARACGWVSTNPPEVHLRHAKTWVAASRSGGRVRDATRTRLSRPLGPGPVPLIYLSIYYVHREGEVRFPCNRYCIQFMRLRPRVAGDARAALSGAVLMRGRGEFLNHPDDRRGPQRNAVCVCPRQSLRRSRRA